MAHLHGNEAQAIAVGLVTITVLSASDGLTSWVEYENAVLDWAKRTELNPPQRAQAVRARLAGYAQDLAVFFANDEQRALCALCADV